MTTLQKIAVTAALTVTIGGGLFAAKKAHDAQNEVRIIMAQQAPLAEQIQQLQAERDKATNQIAWLKEELANANKNNLELLKLRGEITALKYSNALAKTNSPATNFAIENVKQPDEEMLNTNTFPAVGTVFPLRQTSDATGTQRLTLFNTVSVADAKGYGSNFHSLLLEKRIKGDWRIVSSILSDEFGTGDSLRVADLYNFDSNTGIAILKIAPRTGQTGQPIQYSWCEWNVISNELVRIIRVCQRPSEHFDTNNQ